MKNARCLPSAASVVLGFALFSGMVSQNAGAFPLPQNRVAEQFQLPSSAEDLEAAGVDFTAIVALNNCSGALVRFTNSKPQDKAMVLTNGHCYEGGFIPSGKALTDKTSARTFKLLSSSGENKIATYHAERLIYATMTGTDISLYRLSKTFADIQKDVGVQALTLSAKHPEAGTPIRVVSGYWKKIYSCNISKFIPLLREGEWDSFDSIKFTQPGCETIGGTSGSPIVNANTNEVIGVNNTGNENGERCTDENPCEIDDAGNVVVEKGASYGQQTYQIYTCLTSNNTFDLNLPSCKLEK